MTQYLIMCRSLTYAQKVARLLERSGINASVVKAPQILTSGGCGYAVAVHKGIDNAVYILKRNNSLNGKVYEKLGGNAYQEVVT